MRLFGLKEDAGPVPRSTTGFRLGGARAQVQRRAVVRATARSRTLPQFADTRGSTARKGPTSSSQDALPAAAVKPWQSDATTDPRRGSASRLALRQARSSGMARAASACSTEVATQGSQLQMSRKTDRAPICGRQSDLHDLTRMASRVLWRERTIPSGARTVVGGRHVIHHGDTLSADRVGKWCMAREPRK